MKSIIWENAPAAAMEDRYLLGNGSFGMSMDGGVPTEEIILNHDTLWSGCETIHEKPGFYQKFLQARQETLEGRYREANDRINNELEGYWGQTYLPLASAFLTIGQKNDRRNMLLRRVLLTEEDPWTEYRRSLDLHQAVAETSYCRNGIRYRRTAFASYPAGVGVVRLTAEDGKFSFALSLISKLRHTCRMEGQTVLLTGIAPAHAEPSYTSVKPALIYPPDEESCALRFAAIASVTETDGKICCDGMRVYVQDASYAVVLLCAATNYAGYGRKRNSDEKILVKNLKKRLNVASQKGFDILLAEHTADVRTLTDTFELELGDEVTGDLPTSQRMEVGAERVDDPSICALAVKAARYLMIAGSRPGSQPLNLQGIWNDMVSPPWACNYTTNINLEMNYWPCEPFHLGQCAEPLLQMVEELADSGKKTARHYYHMNGWTAHHNTDLWRLSTPSCEDATWAWWPMGGLWLCQQLWTHYQYSGSEEELKWFYPIVRGAAQFALDYLTEDGNYLVTAPSVSPENKHVNGEKATYRQMLAEVDPRNRFSSNSPYVSAVTRMSTMDLSLIREIFEILCEVLKRLGTDKELIPQIQNAVEKLPPFQIGRWGQLQEWMEDEEECMPGMGHMSHLVGVYPGQLIREDRFSEAFQGAAVSLQRRAAHGGLKVGWPGAWAICLGARLGLKELCAQTARIISQKMGAGFLMKENQQIDAIFGWAAGVAEMLLQSTAEEVRLLPALPPSWREGRFHGFCARGGLEFSLRWKKGKIEEGRVKANRNHTFLLKAPNLLEVLHKDGRIENAANSQITIQLEKGEEAKLIFSNKNTESGAVSKEI